jgi:hypothetical protein
VFSGHSIVSDLKTVMGALAAAFNQWPLGAVGSFPMGITLGMFYTLYQRVLREIAVSPVAHRANLLTLSGLVLSLSLSFFLLLPDNVA